MPLFLFCFSLSFLLSVCFAWVAVSFYLFFFLQCRIRYSDMKIWCCISRIFSNAEFIIQILPPIMSHMPALGDCHISQFTYAIDISSIVCWVELEFGLLSFDLSCLTVTSKKMYYSHKTRFHLSLCLKFVWVENIIHSLQFSNSSYTKIS